MLQSSFVLLGPGSPPVTVLAGVAVAASATPPNWFVVRRAMSVLGQSLRHAKMIVAAKARSGFSMTWNVRGC